MYNYFKDDNVVKNGTKRHWHWMFSMHLDWHSIINVHLVPLRFPLIPMRVVIMKIHGELIIIWYCGFSCYFPPSVGLGSRNTGNYASRTPLRFTHKAYNVILWLPTVAIKHAASFNRMKSKHNLFLIRNFSNDNCEWSARICIWHSSQCQMGWVRHWSHYLSRDFFHSNDPNYNIRLLGRIRLFRKSPIIAQARIAVAMTLDTNKSGIWVKEHLDNLCVLKYIFFQQMFQTYSIRNHDDIRCKATKLLFPSNPS